MKRVPLEGKTFGKWKVLSYEGCADGKKSLYQCQCMGCGRIFTIRADRLSCGRTRQCGECRIAEDRRNGRKHKSV